MERLIIGILTDGYAGNSGIFFKGERLNVPIVSIFTSRLKCLFRTRPTTRTVSPTAATGLGGWGSPFLRPVCMKDEPDDLRGLLSGRALEEAEGRGLVGLGNAAIDIVVCRKLHSICPDPSSTIQNSESLEC